MLFCRKTLFQQRDALWADNWFRQKLYFLNLSHSFVFGQKEKKCLLIDHYRKTDHKIRAREKFFFKRVMYSVEGGGKMEAKHRTGKAKPQRTWLQIFCFLFPVHFQAEIQFRSQDRCRSHLGFPISITYRMLPFKLGDVWSGLGQSVSGVCSVNRLIGNFRNRNTQKKGKVTEIAAIQSR